MRQSAQAHLTSMDNISNNVPSLQNTHVQHNQNSFVSGYTGFLNQSWSGYDLNNHHLLNDTDGLYGITNHLSVLECVGTLNYLIEQLSTCPEHEQSKETKEQIATLKEQLHCFESTMKNIEQMERITKQMNESCNPFQLEGKKKRKMQHQESVQWNNIDPVPPLPTWKNKGI